jgi:hypothetical protein
LTRPSSPPEKNARHESIDDHVGSHSTILTGQLPLKHWCGWINNPARVDALLDHLVHIAYHVMMNSESLQ